MPWVQVSPAFILTGFGASVWGCFRRGGLSALSFHMSEVERVGFVDGRMLEGWCGSVEGRDIFQMVSGGMGDEKS
jgi:hypothetical protein